MACCGSNSFFPKVPSGQKPCCPDAFGCCQGVCPDFSIKRHDTVPPFILSATDCNGPLDLTNCIVEASMWAKAKLKRAIDSTEDWISFADNIGFNQSYPGDIILVDRVRSPELMLIVGYDEDDKTVNVLRGYQATTPTSYPKGTKLRIFRLLNGSGETKMVYEEVEQIDGTRSTILSDSQLIYKWRSTDTCLPGCYYLEIKLLKIIDEIAENPDEVFFPSVISLGPCSMGFGVESVRRFPVSEEGFLIQITDSPTSETLGS